jgi:hypothetical protein
MSFTKKTEDFTCEHCGAKIIGNGYTNHCPACLWSKHVDNEPGDRKNECQGLMEPVGIRKKDGQNDVLHECTMCGIEKWNQVTEQDNSDIIVKLSTNPVEK